MFRHLKFELAKVYFILAQTVIVKVMLNILLSLSYNYGKLFRELWLIISPLPEL